MTRDHVYQVRLSSAVLGGRDNQGNFGAAKRREPNFDLQRPNFVRDTPYTFVGQACDAGQRPNFRFVKCPVTRDATNSS